jgi:hypothetical protein
MIRNNLFLSLLGIFLVVEVVTARGGGAGGGGVRVKV